MSWKDAILNPYVIAGAGTGAYVGHSKYGKKHGHYATAGGVVAGALAGMLVKRLIGGPAPAPAQIAPTQQPAAVEGHGAGDYIDLDSGSEYAPPPPRGAGANARAEYEAEQASRMNLGSLSDGDGFGSLSVDAAFDADEIDYSDLLPEDDDGYHGRGVN